MPRLSVPLKLLPVPKKQLCKKIPRSFLEKGSSSAWNCSLVWIMVLRLGFSSRHKERVGIQVSHIL